MKTINTNIDNILNSKYIKSKDIFQIILDIFYNSHSPSTTISNTRDILLSNKILESFNPNYQLHYKNKINKILKYVLIIKRNKLLINPKYLKWKNIENVSILFEYLETYHKTNLTKIKNKLNRLFSKMKNNTNHSLDVNKYNLVYEHTLNELFYNYNLHIETEKHTYLEIIKLFSTLNKNMQKNLLLKLEKIISN